MKRPPFVSQANQMPVIDYLCLCGGKRSDHQHDLQGCEEHGGGLPDKNCKRFRFATYMYEQSKVEQEAVLPAADCPIEEDTKHHVV